MYKYIHIFHIDALIELVFLQINMVEKNIYVISLTFWFYEILISNPSTETDGMNRLIDGVWNIKFESPT